ncbi:enoyl-CoA hydratase/isomerase family protein [Streptomyces roseoverticillatus]|nr:enoyl-CoA hydratase/isomerase family protein [Streptomyces roseoverticillatus]
MSGGERDTRRTEAAASSHSPGAGPETAVSGSSSSSSGPGVRVEVRADGVALVTLDRPERHNALDLAAVAELTDVWRRFRFDDTVRAVVLTGAGNRAFCTGIDRSAAVPQPGSPYSLDDPLRTVGPKSADLWKPVVAAVGGMACGGAFYLLGEAEFIVAAENATFFDPHTTYGMVSAYETIHMAQRMPFGEAARLALMGTAERLSAQRAYEIGLVSELTAPGEAVAAALRAAAVIAACPTEAVQGTVRALWAAKEATRERALSLAPHLISLGNLPPEEQARLFASRERGHRLR